MICCRYWSWENKCSMCRVLFMVIENKQPYSQLCEQLWWFYAWLPYALIFYNSKSAVCKQMLPTIGYFKGNCWYSMFFALTMTCMHAYNKKKSSCTSKHQIHNSVIYLNPSDYVTVEAWLHNRWPYKICTNKQRRVMISLLWTKTMTLLKDNVTWSERSDV